MPLIIEHISIFLSSDPDIFPSVGPRHQKLGKRSSIPEVKLDIFTGWKHQRGGTRCHIDENKSPLSCQGEIWNYIFVCFHIKKGSSSSSCNWDGYQQMLRTRRLKWQGDEREECCWFVLCLALLYIMMDSWWKKTANPLCHTVTEQTETPLICPPWSPALQQCMSSSSPPLIKTSCWIKRFGVKFSGHIFTR